MCIRDRLCLLKRTSRWCISLWFWCNQAVSLHSGDWSNRDWSLWSLTGWIWHSNWVWWYRQYLSLHFDWWPYPRHWTLGRCLSWYQETILTRWEGLDCRRIYPAWVGAIPSGSLLCREKKLNIRRVRWPSLWGVCHVLSSRYSNPSARWTDYTRNCRLYKIRQRTWLFPPRNGRSRGQSYQCLSLIHI